MKALASFILLVAIVSAQEPRECRGFPHDGHTGQPSAGLLGGATDPIPVPPEFVGQAFKDRCARLGVDWREVIKRIHYQP